MKSEAMRHSYTVIFYLVVLVFFLSGPHFVGQAIGQTPDEESGESLLLKNDLPTGFNTYFAGSGECILCHSSMVDESGVLVSIVNDWRSSMMANSAKDPFWRAKVSHEILVNPQHTQALEDVCTRCHAPMGYFDAHLGGQEFYSVADMLSDPLALDGASCTVCHQISPESLGNYSGNLLIGLEKEMWGPYEDPFTNPMINHTGYTPVEGDHILDSQMCGSCHTLITNTVDLEGELTGTQFVEQAIYHEWLNSDFPGSGTSCQACHVPQINDDVVISSMPPWLGSRTPFGKHHLAGANVFMLQLMKENMVELGLTATAAQMDSTISRAKQMLQVSSLEMEIEYAGRTPDSLFVDISLQNMAGHKFPGGYPSRRVFVTLIVSDEAGDTLFFSGAADENFELLEEDVDFEPHHSVISHEEQVQIYELVMGNVEYEPTTVLEQAFVPLKDNRIPPTGFTTTHPSYDTVLIAGNALNDPNFNKIMEVEGSGQDIVHYRIATDGNTGKLMINARVFYQTVSGKWLEQMFDHSSDEIDAFKSYYENANKEPVLLASENMESVLTGNIQPAMKYFSVGPNPASSYVLVAGVDELNKAVFYDLQGKEYLSPAAFVLTGNGYYIETPVFKGVMVLRCFDRNGGMYTSKLVVN